MTNGFALNHNKSLQIYFYCVKRQAKIDFLKDVESTVGLIMLLSLIKVPKDSILQVWFKSQMTIRELNNKGYKALFSSCWYLDHTKYGTDWTKYYKCEPSPYSKSK